MKKVLAISGKRFSGKDTFAGFLVACARERGTTLETFAFAGESKRLFVAQQAAQGVAVDLARLTSDRAYKEEWRPKLTKFTVDSIAADPLVFCRAVADRIAASANPALITDLRLTLEVEHLRARFDLRVLRLVRTDQHRAQSGWSWKAGVDDHHTETELDDPALWDERIANDGSEAALAAKARAVISSLPG